MLAVMFRVNCGIPCVLMGECGCGKTRLVEYLSAFLHGGSREHQRQSTLVLGIHGGTTEEDIYEHFEKACETARQRALEPNSGGVFVFLDEINTCQYMGLINEVITLHSLNGKPLEKGVQVLSALNPYRTRTANQKQEGLEVQGKKRTAEEEKMARLVYKVRPIPDGTLNYVFDYGALENDIEQKYIQAMVERSGTIVSGSSRRCVYDHQRVQLFSEMVWVASTFIRKHEGDPTFHDWSSSWGTARTPPLTPADRAAYQATEQSIRPETSATSLRDVKRVLQLVKWFAGTWTGAVKGGQPKITRPEFPTAEWYKVRDLPLPPELDLSRFPPKQLTVRAIVLSLSLVYYFRLSHRADRVELSRLLEEKIRQWPDPTESAFKVPKLISDEQTWYCNSMVLDDDIARNEAVKENIFVMSVCILNRVPLFVVGKPGSSKSLGMSIVRNNLKGPKRSPADTWKETDDCFLVPYQCSKLTLADSITGQYQSALAAHREKITTEEGTGLRRCKTVTVLLLDEVGLAEHSPDMPLKALHDILNDDEVVTLGISNWVLDPAKMNRAVCLQRPDPDKEDLELIGSVLVHNQKDMESKLKTLAEVYHQVNEDQKWISLGGADPLQRAFFGAFLSAVPCFLYHHICRAPLL
jgi:MoxR-like ATPase